MKKTFTCLLLLFFVSFVRFSYAQKASAIQGRIVNENYAAAEAATIALLRYRDSSVIRSISSDKNGQFLFNAIRADKYLLQISKTGYHKIYLGPYAVAAGRTVVIDTIRLQLAEVNLNEVKVTDKRHYYEVRPDKTVLNMDRSILAAGSSALTVLSTAPGVKVSSNGDIALRAGQKAGIFVNGKQVRLEGEDLAAYLRGLQAAEVETIELIHNPSARFDAAGSGGVINIVLKKGKYVGFNGTVTANADYGTFGKGGTAVNGNYRSQKINIFGGVGYSYVKTDHTINTLRNVNSDEVTSFDTHYYNTQKTPAYTYRLGTDYLIDADHTLGFLVRGNSEKNTFDKSTNTYMAVNGVADSLISTTSVLKRNRDFVAYNLNYLGTIGHTKQTLGADADLTILNKHSYENIVSHVSAVRKPIAQVQIPAYNDDTLSNDAPTRIVNESVNINYVNPLSKANRLDAGLKGSYVKSENSQYFNAMVGSAYQPVALLTSKFDYTERKGTAYVNYHHTGKTLSYYAGLSTEYISSDADAFGLGPDVERKYWKLYPAVQVSYKLNKSLLVFDYNRRVDQQPYESLNPIISYSDNYNYRMGNAYLRAAYTDRFQVSFTGQSKYQVVLFASSTDNFANFTSYLQNDANKILITTKRNLKTANNYGANLTLPLQFTKWWEANLYAEASMWQFKDYQGYLNKWAKDLILNLDQDFVITKTLSATLHAQMESATFYGVYAYRPVAYITPGLSQQLFHNQGSLSLTAFDLLNTNRDKNSVRYRNLDINAYDKKETRYGHLTFMYNFGKRTVKGSRRHTVGNSEEQKRMSGN